MNDIMDAKVFGVDHQKCRFTGLPLESGSGALSVDEQAIANWGKLQFELATLTRKRTELAKNLENAIVERSGTAIAGQMRSTVGARQLSSYELAAQDTKIRSLQSQVSAAATEHEALAVKIAEVGAQLKEEGIFDRHGMGPASTYIGAIHDKGWAT